MGTSSLHLPNLHFQGILDSQSVLKEIEAAGGKRVGTANCTAKELDG